MDEWYNQKKVVLEPTCPFIINNQYNPCKQTECDNVDWTAPNPNSAGMNKKCRRKVDSYCEEYAYLDPMCACWRNEFRDTPQCREYISQYNNSSERGCKADDFPIEMNKDFDKYIKKDRIPCWGCSIEN